MTWEPPKDPDFLRMSVVCRCGARDRVPESEAKMWTCDRCRLQTSLFSDDGEAVEEKEDGSIDAAFRRFHAENPQVYVRLVDLVRDWKRRGGKRCGIKMLFEVVRWERGPGRVSTTGDEEEDGFRLSNNFHARYAREIMEKEPDLDGIFEVRELRRR